MVAGEIAIDVCPDSEITGEVRRALDLPPQTFIRVLYGECDIEGTFEVCADSILRPP